jgi:hypothetical protein
MRQAACLIGLVGVLVSFCSAQLPDDPLRKPLMAYELYSWPNGKGGFTFCILPNTSSEKSAEQVFNEKTLLRGTTQLKRKIAELPSGARLYWNNRIPWGKGTKAQGSESLGYPPADVREQIRRYAEKHHVEVQILNPLFNP